MDIIVNLFDVSQSHGESYLFSSLTPLIGCQVQASDSVGATGNFALLLTEPGQTSRFAPVPLRAYFDF